MNNFLKFLEVNNLRRVEVANYLNVSKQYVTQLCNGTAELSDDRVSSLAENGEWDVSMLLEGTRAKTREGKVNHPRQRAPRTIPLLPFSAVAGWMNDNNGVDAFRGDTVTFSDFSERGADCAIRVDGDSMLPRYRSGDILAIRILKDPSFFQWGKVYVLNTTQGCIVKRLFPDKENPDNIVCRSENSESYPDYSIGKGDILAVAIVVGHAGVE